MAALLARHAINRPEHVFIESIEAQRSITYAQFKGVTDRLAVYLRKAGFKPGDRALLLAGNGIEHLFVFLGVQRYGATACVVNLEANLAYLGDILEALKPRLVLYEDPAVAQQFASYPCRWVALGHWEPDSPTGFFAELAGLAEHEAPEPVNQPRDDAYVSYTSGTSSKPKGVIHRYEDLFCNMDGLATRLGVTPSDRILEFRSLNWLSSQCVVLAAFARGATIVLGRKFSVTSYPDWIKERKVTIAVGVPAVVAMLLSRPIDMTAADVPHLRFVTSSSAPLALDHWRAFEEHYRIPIASGYGCTEASGFICSSDEKTRRIGSAGLPIDCQNVSIIRADGSVAAPGEIGEVEIGGGPDREYRYLDYDGTPKVIARGRFRTGDVGYLDKDGYLFLTGRVKDLIIRGGVNIAPAEIEGVLLQASSEIQEAVAVGVPDPIYGEEVVGYVVIKAGTKLDLSGILGRCAERLPAFKQPKEVIALEALPRNANGKILRSELVEDWKRRHGQ